MQLGLTVSPVALAAGLFDLTRIYDWLLTSATLPSGFVFSRASSATDIINGVLTLFSTDQPRISVANGLLIEEAGTNLVGNAFGSMAGGAVTTGQTDPLNGTAAFKYVANTTTGAHAVQASSAIAPVGATVYTISCFVKYVNVQFVQLLMPGGHGATNCYANFDLLNDTVTAQGAGSLGAQITPLTGGWHRIALSYTTVASPTSNVPIIVAALQTGTDGRYPSFTGTGTEEFWVFGPQVEQRPFMTSYIPTTSGSASRAAETCVATLSSLDTVRALFTEFQRITGIDTAAAQGPKAVQIDDGTSANRHFIGIIQSTAAIVGQTASAGVTSASVNTAGAGLVTYRTAYRVNTNDFRQATNGVLSSADVTGSLPAGMSRVCLGHSHAAGGEMNGYIRRVSLFNSSKTDAQLQALSA